LQALAGTNDSIEVDLQDNYLNIITSGDYLRNYKMRLIESEASSVSSLLQMTFDSKIAQRIPPYPRLYGYCFNQGYKLSDDKDHYSGHIPSANHYNIHSDFNDL
jgi:hypothetical protein